MKIIYIPVVIPVNIRTFFALVLCLVASILLIVGVSTRNWLMIEMRGQPQSSNGRITRIVAYQALQFVDVYICSPSTHFKGDFCAPTHVVYSQCDDSSDSWCVGGTGFLIAFACGIVAAVAGILSLGVGLVREMRHFIVSGVAALAAIVGCVAYMAGYQRALHGGLFPAIDAEATSTGGVVNYHVGFSYYCFLVGTMMMVIGAGISTSLLFCAAHGVENRAHNPPKIQLVHMDAKSTQQIATLAPQPGFVQLSDGRFSIGGEDDDDDDDLIVTVPPSQHQLAASLESGGSEPVTRENTGLPLAADEQPKPKLVDVEEVRCDNVNQ